MITEPGRPGEMQIQGPNVIDGYFDAPLGNAAAMVLSSVRRAIKDLLAKTSLPEWKASQNVLGIVISGQKPA